MYEDLFEKLIEDDPNEFFEIGDRVIIRSNEDEPLMIGEYLGEQEIGLKSSLPLVKSERDRRTYMVGGIVRIYSEELLRELEKMSPKNQWNYLSKYYKR